jgi:hypothetical protein
MTGVAKNTVVKLLAEIGAACEKYQQETLRNLPCKRVQCVLLRQAKERSG